MRKSGAYGAVERMGTDTSPAFVAEGYFGGVGRSEAGDVSVPFF
jgi:hypothetical protein